MNAIVHCLRAQVLEGVGAIEVYNYYHSLCSQMLVK